MTPPSSGEVEIRTALDTDRTRIRGFYRAADYAGEVGVEDQVIVAEASGVIVGLVRLVPENGVMVLRGMRVSAAHQRAGIGSLLLAAVDQALGPATCYCIPYQHLRDFYGRIGFQELASLAAPPFLAGRLSDYRAQRPERFILMVRARRLR